MAASRPEDAHRLFAEAFNEGDLEALLALYEPGARLLPAPREVATGHDEIREALRGFLTMKGRITVETRYAIEVGDVALLSARWRLTGGTGPDGQAIEMEGTTAEIVRRQPDGRWLYVIDHPNACD
jgi:uncharacterized protein (TIGR02246 family)